MARSPVKQELLLYITIRQRKLGDWDKGLARMCGRLGQRHAMQSIASRRLDDDLHEVLCRMCGRHIDI